jgi:HAD superfamily hydrolase (TIGR01509 family)
VTNGPAGWGAIFDWDGVVIDSSRCHETSWERLAKEERRTLPPDHFEKGFGRKNEIIIPEILGWTTDRAEIARLSLRKEELYRELVRDQEMEPMPGVRPWLERLKAAGVPCSVGTSTHRANIELSMAKVGLSSFFQGIITSEDVQQGKPNPEVFLKAAALIDRPPAKCVVFEDSFAGLRAAWNGGMKCVGVATTNSADSLAGHADKVVHRLDELQIQDLAAWFS